MQITKPGKQRKMLYQASLHARRRHFSAPLSPELKASHGVNALPVRSGDTVHITRGDHRGLEGKVTSVDRKKYRVFIEGLTREKVDGTTIFVPVHPSKVMITRLNIDDKWRKKILERKREAVKELEKVEAKKPPKEVTIEKPIIPVEKPSKKKAKTEEKPKPDRKKAPKKPVKKKGKKEVKREERKETKAKKRKPSAKKARSKPKSSRKAATSGRTEKSRRTGGGK